MALRRARSRAEVAETLAELGRLLSQSLDPAVVADRIVESVRSLVGTHLAVLYRLDPHSGDLIVLARSGELGPLDVLPRGRGLGGLVVREGRAVVTRDITTDARVEFRPEERAAIEKRATRVVAGVPLNANGVVIGVLAAGDFPGRTFSSEEIGLLQSLADTAAMAIENARIYRESETRRREAESLASVSRLLLETLDREALARHIAESVQTLLGARAAVLRELDPSGALVAVGDSGVAPLARNVRLGPDRGMAGVVVQGGRPLATPDFSSDPRFALPPDIHGRFSQEDRALLGVPLRTRSGIVGALVVSDRTGRVFTDDEIRLALAFADAAALALQNTRLYAEMDRRRREAEVLADVERSISASRDLSRVLERVAEGARELCRADAARIALQDAGAPVMAFRHAVGPQPDNWQDMRVAPGTGAGGHVLLTGRPFRTDNYPEDPRIARELREYARRTGTIAEIVVPIPGDGQVAGLLYVINRSPRPFTDQDQDVLGRLADHAAVAIRNSRLFAREQDARASAETSAGTLRLLFESSPLPMLVFDRATLEILEVNETAVAHLGYSREELLGQPTTVLVVPEEHDRLRALQRDVLESQHQSTLRSGPWKYRRKDGSIIDVESASHPLDFHGRAARLAVVIDLTERLRAEEEARRLAAIVQSADDAILSIGLDGLVQSWNPGAERMLGYSSAEVTGQPAARLSPPERAEELREILARVVRGEPVERFETVALTKDGKPVDVALTISPIRDAAGQVIGASAIARDITERRRLEDELRQAQKMEAVGRLAGGVAHDFNNLLTVVSGRSQFLLDRLESEHPGRRDVELILRSTERAANLTRQLLAFSRKQILDPKILDLDTVVGAIEPLLRQLIGESIDFTFAGRHGLGRVRADPGQIEQVILNLAINARDAMPRGGRLTIETANVELGEADAAQHAEVAAGPYVMLTVSDTGIGMDAATLARIFEPFFTTKAVGQGTGLGLATVYGIVKQSNGHIIVSSEPGRGATFRVYLPRVDVAVAADVAADDAAAMPAPPPRGSETVLLVEDEPDVRELTMEVLTSQGYAVLEVATPAAALSLAERHDGPIHLVLTDVVLPGLSGRDLADRLLAARPGLKLLFMSGYADTAIVHHGVVDPGTAFLPKPFTSDALLRKVREVLDRTP